MSSSRLLLLLVPLLVGIDISGEFTVTTMTHGASAPALGDSPTVIATSFECCVSADTCPLAHGFDLLADDVLYVVCHVRDDGVPVVLNSTNIANQIYTDTANGNVSMTGAWIRHSGGPGVNTIVECDGPDLTDEMVISVMQIRGTVAAPADPVDASGMARTVGLTLDCPVVETQTDNTLVTCSSVARFDHSASPTPLYTSEVGWSPLDFSDDPTCTSTGFAGMVYIPDFTTAGNTPAESWDHVSSDRIITATVAFKP